MTNEVLMTRITEREVPKNISSDYLSEELKWEKPLLLLNAEYCNDVVKESYQTKSRFYCTNTVLGPLMHEKGTVTNI